MLLLGVEVDESVLGSRHGCNKESNGAGAVRCRNEIVRWPDLETPF